MEEQEISKLLVAGSTPVSPTKRKDIYGLLWQEKRQEEIVL